MSGNKQKVIIMSSLFISLIILLVIFMISNNNASSGVWIIYAMIIAINSFALGSALFASRVLHRKIVSLPKSYQDVYMNVQDLVTLHTKSWKTRREIQNIILEVFEHAALEERDVNEVINNDIEQFVKEYLVDSTETFSIRYILLYSTSLYLFFILLMKLYKVLRADTISIDNFKNEPLDVGITLTYLIISYVFYPLLMYTVHYSAKKQLDSYKKFIVVIPMLIPILLMFGLIFIDNPGLREFLDTPTAIFSSLFTFILGIVLFIVCTVFTVYSKE